MPDDSQVHDFLLSDLGAALPLHISLSRPLSLPGHKKDSYLEEIKSTLLSSRISAFNVHPIGLAWFRSPDSDRSFLILRVASAAPASDGPDDGSNPELMDLLRRCNMVATTFEQPALYQKNKNEETGNAFHISIGWTFGLPNDAPGSKVLKLFQRQEFQDMRNWKIQVEGVKVKVGNVVSHVALGGKQGSLEEYFGQ